MSVCASHVLSMLFDVMHVMPYLETREIDTLAAAAAAADADHRSSSFFSALNPSRPVIAVCAATGTNMQQESIIILQKQVRIMYRTTGKRRGFMAATV
jgi:hypothetical protein